WQQLAGVSSDSVAARKGMSIGLLNGHVRINAHGWQDLGVVAPNSWHYVAVAQSDSAVKGYLDGNATFESFETSAGRAETPVVLGASVYRMRTTPESPFGEYFTGSIGDVEIWQGWPDDFVYLDDVQSEYYVSPETNVEPVPVIDLRAVAAAEGGEPYPAGSKSSPWVDLAGNRQDAALTNFCDLPNSGWLGDGSTESPYRLSFDGDGDVAVIEAGTVPELDETLEQTVELWVNVEVAEHVMYLIDWREALDGENGMSLIYNAGTLE